MTVFLNEVQGLCSDVLPHPLVTEMDNLHVCFVALRKSIPTDLKFVLAVKPQRLKGALVSLKANRSFMSTTNSGREVCWWMRVFKAISLSLDQGIEIFCDYQ